MEDDERRFDYEGDETHRAAITGALARVVDPEMALGILDVGLVYRVTVEGSRVQVLMTMTSAACPVVDVIVDDVAQTLERALPGGYAVGVDVCWEPAWTPERMSGKAKRFMGW
jgi:metal-sulfur cluster biosynthetic enzyme